MNLLIMLLLVAICVSVIESLKRRRAEELAERGEDCSLEASRPPLIRPGFLWSLVLIFGIGWFLLNGWMFWPPRWMERRDQRKEVFKRVESAGGWAKLLEDTRTLLATNDSPVVYIRPRSQTNLALPAAVAALKARDIELSKWEGSSTAFLHIYGYHSTGGRGQANYWLFIVDKDSGDKAVASLRSRFGTRTVRQVTNSVFEVY